MAGIQLTLAPGVWSQLQLLVSRQARTIIGQFTALRPYFTNNRSDTHEGISPTAWSFFKSAKSSHNAARNLPYCLFRGDRHLPRVTSSERVKWFVFVFHLSFIILVTVVRKRHCGQLPTMHARVNLHGRTRERNTFQRNMVHV